MVRGFKAYGYPPLNSYVVVKSFNLGICWRVLQILLGCSCLYNYAQDPSLSVATVEPETMILNQAYVDEAYFNATFADKESMICQSAGSFIWSFQRDAITHRPSLCADLDEGETLFATPSEVFIPTFSQDKWYESSAGTDCDRLKLCCNQGNCFGDDTRLFTEFKYLNHETMLGQQICECSGQRDFFVKGPQAVKISLSGVYSRDVPGIGFKTGSTFIRSGNTPQYVLIPRSKYGHGMSHINEYLYQNKGNDTDQPIDLHTTENHKIFKGKMKIPGIVLQTRPAARTVRKEGRQVKSTMKRANSSAKTASLLSDDGDQEVASTVGKTVQFGIINEESFTFIPAGEELSMTLESWMEHAYSMLDDTSLIDLKPEGANSILDAYNRRTFKSKNNRTDPYPTFRMSGLLLQAKVSFQNHEVHRLRGQNSIIAKVTVSSSPGSWQTKDRTYVISPLNPNTGKLRMMKRRLSGVRIQVITTGELGTWSISLFVRFAASTLVVMALPSAIIAFICTYLLSSASAVYYAYANAQLCLDENPFQLGLKAMFSQLTFDEHAKTYTTDDGEEFKGYTEEDLNILLVEATRSLETPVTPQEMETVIQKMFQLHDPTRSGVMTSERLSYLALGNDPYDMSDASAIYTPNPVHGWGDLSNIFLRRSKTEQERKEQ